MGTDCCGSEARSRVCAEGARYVEKESSLPPKRAVVACEGACIKGEVARVAANILTYQLERDAAVRICLGDAATGDSGMVTLVTNAPEVIAVEGCPLHCATAILRTRLPDLKTTVVNATQYYDYDRTRCFEIFDLPRAEIDEHALKVAQEIQQRHFQAPTVKPDKAKCGCSGKC